MTNEEIIVKALENLQAGQERIEKTVGVVQAAIKALKHTQQEQGASLKRLEQGQAQQKTLLKVLEAGQNDVRENMATKADLQDSKAEQGKLKRRVENLEENTKTPNPQKN
jgi:peptidoglycan hydrolase CwlO-like protein